MLGLWAYLSADGRTLMTTIEYQRASATEQDIDVVRRFQELTFPLVIAPD